MCSLTQDLWRFAKPYPHRTFTCIQFRVSVSHAKTYIDQAVKIILDNAKYQGCKLVREHLDKINEQRSNKIELCYLPAYSPNLNLIERIWQWTKSKFSTA